MDTAGEQLVDLGSAMHGCNSRAPAAEAKRPMLWSCLAAAEQNCRTGRGLSQGGQGITQICTSLSVCWPGVCHLTMASCSTSFLLCLLLLITHVLLMFYMNNK